jgi:GTPase
MAIAKVPAIAGHETFRVSQIREALGSQVGYGLLAVAVIATR